MELLLLVGAVLIVLIIVHRHRRARPVRLADGLRRRSHHTDVMNVEVTMHAPDDKEPYTYGLVVARTNEFQAQLGRQATTGVTAQFPCVLERESRADGGQIAVWCQGGLAGYLRPDDATMIGPGLLALERQFGTKIGVLGELVGQPSGVGYGLALCWPIPAAG